MARRQFNQLHGGSSPGFIHGLMDLFVTRFAYYTSAPMQPSNIPYKCYGPQVAVENKP